jgi:deoxyinosine 3'endonuclease (endonuclease V)
VIKLSKNFSVKKAHNTQVCLSKNLILEDKLPTKIRTVGGVDVSYVGNVGIGAVTVLDYESLERLKAQVTTCEVKIPTFRHYFRVGKSRLPWQQSKN